MAERIHEGQPVRWVGADPQSAKAIVILLHGRGADATSMLPLAEALQMEGVRFAIPEAAHNRWYPQSAFSPLEANEPDLTSALQTIDDLIAEVHAKGLDDRQVILGGFSQGACLAAEYFARHAKKYGGLFLFSGALIGPEGTPRDYPGSFEGMTVFIGGSDVDPWVPHDLLKDTAKVFKELGAEVDFRTYPGMRHTVNQEEVERARGLVAEVLGTNK